MEDADSDDGLLPSLGLPTLFTAAFLETLSLVAAWIHNSERTFEWRAKLGQKKFEIVTEHFSSHLFVTHPKVYHLSHFVCSFQLHNATLHSMNCIELVF